MTSRFNRVGNPKQEPARLFRWTPRDVNAWTFLSDRHAGFTMAPHCHEEHEINVCVRGSGTYRVGNEGAEQSCPLATGQILYLPGGIPHRLESREHIIIRGICVHPTEFESVKADPAFRALADLRRAPPPRLTLDPSSFAAFLNLYELLRSEQSNADALHSTCLARLAQVAALELVRLLARTENTPPLSPAQQRVLNARVWLDHNFAEDVSLDRLAEMSGMSASHFSFLFQKAVGKPPRQYQLERRLEAAAKLLAQTGIPVLDVSLDTGFHHLAHFNRCFKQYARCTPTAYRKKHQLNR